jgi:hypothetical protein
LGAVHTPGFTSPASAREMPEEQNFATLPEARPNLAGGRGMRRDFQYPFWEDLSGNYLGSVGPIDPGLGPLDRLDPATDMGLGPPLGYLGLDTDT